MQFLGNGDQESPIFRNYLDKADIEKISESYIDVIKLVRDMFVKANLVHGDFSEYNVLYHNQEIYVIDVSQAIESEHPFAFDFLRRDLYNINSIFKKLGTKVFKLR